jgi:hypothetical protein
MPQMPPPNSNRVFVVLWVTETFAPKTVELRLEEVLPNDELLVEVEVRVIVGLPKLKGTVSPKSYRMLMEVDELLGLVYVTICPEMGVALFLYIDTPGTL